MKKVAFWSNYTNFSHNRAFDINEYALGEDIGYPLILLKKKFAEQGILLETLDMDAPENYDAIIFSDYPAPRRLCCDINKIPREKKYLILTECEMIYPLNRNTNFNKEFKTVFAYNDDLVNNCGYKKLCLPNRIKYPELISDCNKKFSALIASNKYSTSEGELYSERLRAIEFMEKYHPEEFDLYGIGWDERIFCGSKIICQLNRIPSSLRKIGVKKHISYKGRVDKKTETLQKYKFCFCFENTNNILGYISEKPWDCFFSGCVPIYYGAPNVESYFPDNIYIDFRKYNSYEELYHVLKSMPDIKYNEYVNNIVNFLKSDKVYPFSAECFAETIVREVLG